MLEPSSVEAVDKIVFFWHNCSVPFGSVTWLCDVFKLHLLAARQAFQTVELWSYQTCCGLPDRVNLRLDRISFGCLSVANFL